MRNADRMQAGTQERLRIAVIGTGISGLAAAWLLSQRHDVTLYERSERLGGHSNTVDVTMNETVIPVDTGFIVYNEQTYPNLTALFDHLKVPTEASEMSFAVSLGNGSLEYSGANVATVFAQKRNMLRPRFWSMLRDLRRFYNEAPAQVARLEVLGTTLGDYLNSGKFGNAFRDDHLLPMAAAIWSAPAKAMLDYPAASFIRFHDNHGLLKLKDRPAWRTVRGGSRNYVSRLAKSIAGKIRLNCSVTTIKRDEAGVEVRDASGDVRRYDHIIVAAHADQALSMLSDASGDERKILSAFRYSHNLAVLHTDESLMPKRRAVWSSWNYIGNPEGADAKGVTVTYWMNRLQNLRSAKPLFVTLNPMRPPHAGTIHHSEVYQHPLFDNAAMTAQRSLWSLQGRRRTWFCGSYFGSGFHEDGLQSGLAAAEAFGVRRPWSVANESGRIYIGPERQASVMEALQ
jgi:hypothetical protein